MPLGLLGLGVKCDIECEATYERLSDCHMLLTHSIEQQSVQVFELHNLLLLSSGDCPFLPESTLLSMQTFLLLTFFAS